MKLCFTFITNHLLSFLCLEVGSRIPDGFDRVVTHQQRMRGPEPSIQIHIHGATLLEIHFNFGEIPQRGLSGECPQKVSFSFF